jgi:AraC-like DNA-binding protein
MPHGFAFTCYDTADVAIRDRFDSWQHRLTDAFHLSMRHGEPTTALAARTSVWKLDAFMLSPRTCGAHTLTRDARTVRVTQLDHYKLHVRLYGPGETRVDADGRRLALTAGAFVITDMSRPERMEADAGSTIAVFVPRDSLDRLLPAPLDLHGAVTSAASSAMLVGHLGLLAERLPAMRAEEVPHACQAFMQLLAASLAPSAATLAMARPHVDAAQRRAIGRYIDTHLGDEQLDASALAARFRISRATLYRLFEPLGGVAIHIKERRLARIHSLLLYGTGDLSLARLAEAHGFRHATHFSRDFRQQFGYRPSDLLTPRSALPDTERAAAAPTFARWLQSMHG